MTTIYPDFLTPNEQDCTRSRALLECIRQEITKQGGRITFATFMELALYHPQYGYYCADTFSLGKHGDFITAPELSPLFAQCFARQCAQILAEDETFNILELGAGSGRFAYDLLTELQCLNKLPKSYAIYEISPTLQKKQQALLQTTHADELSHVSWLTNLPSEFNGVIIANEVLDALPVHCFAYNQEIKERYVTWDNQQLGWQLGECSSQSLSDKLQTIIEHYHLPQHYTSEINLAAPTLVTTLATLLQKGVILFADYGYGQQEFYHPERQQGTLTCFYQHTRHNNPLLWPGLQDITTHVDFTTVIENAATAGCNLLGYTTQAAFLLATGITELAAQQETSLNEQDAFHLHQTIKQLTLPTEMGERIKIMALGKNWQMPLLGFTMSDRSREL